MSAGRHSDNTPGTAGKACSSVLTTTVRFVRCRQHSRQQPTAISFVAASWLVVLTGEFFAAFEWIRAAM